MRRLTRWLLCLFVFSIPWEFVVLPGIGTVSRLFGLMAVLAGVLTSVAIGEVRRPGIVLLTAFAFTCTSALSLFWTVSFPLTLDRLLTYAQLLGLVWLLVEYARTRDEQRSVMTAFCLGAVIPVVSQLRNFAADISVAGGGRYSATGMNADDLGVTLVIGIPMAWYLVRTGRGVTRLVGALYCPMAIAGMLLTGTRGAFVAALVALSLVPLTLPVRSARSLLTVGAVVIAAVMTVGVLVPRASWERMFTTWDELAGGGDLTGRTDIWRAGLTVFQERPVLGYGAGAFAPAVERLIPEKRLQSAHNSALAVLVEQGIAGLFVFLVLLSACAVAIARMRSTERLFCAVLALTWFTAAMTLSWDYNKVTWLVFGVVASKETGIVMYRRVRSLRVDDSRGEAFGQPATPYGPDAERYA